MGTPPRTLIPQERKLADELRRVAKRKRITYTELGRRTGVNRNHLGGRMNGRMPMPLPLAVKIADALGLDVSIELTPRESPNGAV